MNRPADDGYGYRRRPNIDDDQVKYTTDKSEEAGWGGMKDTIQQESRTPKGMWGNLK
jgi:hypothetical protein